MSCLPQKPSSFSTAISTGRPWQSQPALRDLVPLHRPIAGEDVFEHAGFDVVRAGGAIGGGWSLVEDPHRGVSALFHAAMEGVLVAPEREHLVLESGQVDLRLNLAVHLASVGLWRPIRGTRLRFRAPRYHPLWHAPVDAHPLEVAAAGSTWPAGGGWPLFRQLEGMFPTIGPPGSHRPRVALWPVGRGYSSCHRRAVMGSLLSLPVGDVQEGGWPTDGGARGGGRPADRPAGVEAVAGPAAWRFGQVALQRLFSRGLVAQSVSGRSAWRNALRVRERPGLGPLLRAPDQRQSLPGRRLRPRSPQRRRLRPRSPQRRSPGQEAGD